VSSPKHYFIGGIGGSGMLPLAVIAKGNGHLVSGSDRAHDQGRTPEKFRWIESQGMILHSQDGSGVTAGVDAIVLSKAVEETVPDVVAARAKNIPIILRADLLLEFFNAAKTRIAIAGTSGKTTTTGMIGYLLKEAGLDPTVMNGGIFRDYARDNPYATAFVGKGDIFVSEVDESDGPQIVSRYQPTLAVLHNITLDHQPMEVLHAMFTDFLAQAQAAILNADDPRVWALAQNFTRKKIFYGGMDAEISARDYRADAGGMVFTAVRKTEQAVVRSALYGQHNVSNMLAAIAVGIEMGLPLVRCAEILSGFTGIRRRLEKTGEKNGIVVIDDFAHNPDKVAATLQALHETPGRLHIFFQPHGYGFLKVVGAELADSFAAHMQDDDRLIMVQPFYAGGTVDRSVDSAQIIDKIQAAGKKAALAEDRATVKAMILKDVRPSDRIIVMGARDDTLSDLAKDLLLSIP
jgi:UDP-N-acetylmuramate--alanine ligase